MFKILDIQKTPSEDNHCFLIEITFLHTGKYGEDFNFGFLDKYYKSNVMLDKEKYEAYYDDMFKDDDHMEIIEKGHISETVFKKPGPYELGYCKILDCSGADSIEHLGDNKYKYSQYISTCYITEATYKQLEEMKKHIDNGFCRWGEYPDQNGAFRSGDAFHDFIGILETFNRFWD